MIMVFINILIKKIFIEIEKKHQIFGVFLNSCSKCLSNFSSKNIEDLKKNINFCDICFKKDGFISFYLECSGCQAKICTFCASNLLDYKAFPCMNCGVELKCEIKKKEEIARPCFFCLKKDFQFSCQKCQFFMCKGCQEIILLKVFLKNTLNKFKKNEKKDIEVI